MANPRAKARIRQARHDIYRQVILAAGERVFGARGFDATKVQEIAEEAGLSVPTLYAVFDGKTELFRTIHEERGRELMARSRAAAQPERPLVDALLDGIATYVGFFAEHPHYLRMHLHERTAWSYPELTTEVQLATWKKGLQLMIQLFRAGVAAGVFVDDDPELSARTMMAINQVHLAEWVRGGMRAPPSTVIARLQQACRRAFCTPPR